jgi:uncharacterized membrane protein (UPF0127 family)
VETVRAVLGGLPLIVQIPMTSEEMLLGLQGHAPLSDMQGMLFLYHPSDYPMMHMGSVSFPIDVVYIVGGSSGARVAGIATGIPGSDTKWQGRGDAVLELAGGWCTRHHVQEGARFTWQS